MMNLPELGDVIDDTYEIRDILGKGGMGAVYLARQINMDRDVAMKILVASGPKFDEMVKRFRREVMAIRNLSHPNTVRIYDFRDDPEGLLYYTMEALKGETLKELMRREGPISPRRVKHVLRQILKSLSEAHSYGIVHRDLKPANIMLVDMHGETDFVKVLDFGIAKVFSENDDDEELTSAGIVVGTLRYMAPEQIAEKTVGPPTDLYGLGLIAIEMLSGQSVFAGTGQWNLIHQQISDDPVPIPEPILRSAIGPVLRQCVEKPYEARFATADAMLKALDALSDDALDTAPLFVASPSGEGWVPASGGGAAGGAVAVAVDLDDAATMVAASPFTAEGALPAPMPAPRDHATPGPITGASVPATSPFAFSGESGALASMGPSSPLVKSSNSRSPVVPLALIVVLLLGGGAGFWFYSQQRGSAPVPPEAGQAQPADPAPAAAVAARELPEPDEMVLEVEEVAPEEETRLVHVSTGEVRAMIFVDGELMGRTPFDVEVGEAPVVVRLEATGYQEQEVLVEPDGPEEVGLEMVAEVVETPEVVAGSEEAPRASSGGRSGGSEAASGRSTTSTGSRKSSRPRKRPEPVEERPALSDGWVDLSEVAPREDASKPKKESAPADDWVEIVPETEKKEEVDIPLF
ncbi:hypothetical protein DL240_00630 [Lujinxingia litoralis]|uniref:Protein kinase domain-containing protein n=1 Tax=Lujinxingia litoralis TaxID=2211119 RepID=A0A328CD11_9DELT|nr:serine/threonine-protein kinase [Lujinxingia litoralis]RAL24749.1 hypothetical protein DL240_00630 [Lujinxingia litoralis]